MQNENYKLHRGWMVLGSREVVGRVLWFRKSVEKVAKTFLLSIILILHAWISLFREKSIYARPTDHFNFNDWKEEMTGTKEFFMKGPKILELYIAELIWFFDLPGGPIN